MPTFTEIEKAVALADRYRGAKDLDKVVVDAAEDIWKGVVEVLETKLGDGRVKQFRPDLEPGMGKGPIGKYVELIHQNISYASGVRAFVRGRGVDVVFHFAITPTANVPVGQNYRWGITIGKKHFDLGNDRLGSNRPACEHITSEFEDIAVKQAEAGVGGEE